MHSATVTMPLAEIDLIRAEKAVLEEKVAKLEENEKALIIKVVNESSRYRDTYMNDGFGNRRRVGDELVTSTSISYLHLDDVMEILQKKAREVVESEINSLNFTIKEKNSRVSQLEKSLRESEDIIQKLKEGKDESTLTEKVKKLGASLSEQEEKNSFLVYELETVKAFWENRLCKMKKRNLWQRIFNIEPE